VTIDSATLLQVLILSAGIYLLLAFLRTTRGSGLVRGLGLALIVGVYGVWGIADAMEWFELKLVIQGLLGFVFVIHAIVFQPELRRGIVSIGGNPLLGRLLRTQHKDVVSEVVAATIAMAKKKQGALIAFERKAPLDAFVEGGVKLDAVANRYLLESLFHHGNVLHDGAAIVRGDRVVAAACLFPLTENIEISKSTGTRHRAALGLTEETDAVTIAVSEETGRISIFKGGKLDRRVKPADVEALLQRRLGMVEEDDEDAAADEPRAARRSLLASLFTEHLGQKFAAVVLASLVFYGAHQDLRFSKDKELRIVPSVGEPVPRAGELIVVLEKGWQLASAPERCSVRFEGTRDQLDVTAQAGGIVRVQPGQRKLRLEEIEWFPPLDPGVDSYWPNGAAVPIEVVGVGELEVQLTPEMLVVDDANLDHRYEARTEQLRFHPRVVTVRGPQRLLEGFVLGFVPVVLGPGDIYDVERTVALAKGHAGLELVEQVTIEFPIVLREEKLQGKVRLPILLWNTTAEEHGFQAPDAEAEFEVYTRGLFGEDAGDEARIAVRTYVQEQLRAFVIIDDLAPGTSTGRVVSLPLTNWRDELELSDLPEDAELRVELISAPELTLHKRENE